LKADQFNRLIGLTSKLGLRFRFDLADLSFSSLASSFSSEWFLPLLVHQKDCKVLAKFIYINSQIPGKWKTRLHRWFSQVLACTSYKIYYGIGFQMSWTHHSDSLYLHRSAFRSRAIRLSILWSPHFCRELVGCCWPIYP